LPPERHLRLLPPPPPETPTGLKGPLDRFDVAAGWIGLLAVPLGLIAWPLIRTFLWP